MKYAKGAAKPSARSGPIAFIWTARAMVGRLVSISALM